MPSNRAAAAVTSFVLGIVSVALCVFPIPVVVGLPTGIIGLVFGIRARKQGDNHWKATAGLTLSSVGIGIALVILLVFLLGLSAGSTVHSVGGHAAHG